MPVNVVRKYWAVALDGLVFSSLKKGPEVGCNHTVPGKVCLRILFRKLQSLEFSRKAKEITLPNQKAMVSSLDMS